MTEAIITILILVSVLASSMWYYHEERGTATASFKCFGGALWRTLVFGVSIYWVIPWILAIVLLKKLGAHKMAKKLERKK